MHAALRLVLFTGLAAGLSAGLLAGCDDTIFSNGGGGSFSDGGSGDGGSGDGGSGDGGAATEDWCGVLTIINNNCLTCHSAGSQFGDLDLETDPHAALVGAPSTQSPGRTLVVAGDPDASFLVDKVEGTQDPTTEGTEMPPGSGLSTDQAAIVRTWITAGATDECNDTGIGGDTGGGHYHPDGYSDPTAHGLEAKLHEQTCTDCHGDDLTGAGAIPSCDTCHGLADDGVASDAWRTECTFCHGGVDNNTGAPPEEIDDGAVDSSFGAHTHHVTQNNHAPFDCTQCHTKPTNVLSVGHLFDSTPAQAELNFSAGLSASGTWNSSARSCSNLYCHGNGRGNNGSVRVSDAPLACDSCHPDASSGRDAWDNMSGEHEDHMREGLVCQDCHSGTTSEAQVIIGPDLHVNGTVDFLPDGGSIVRSGDTCNGGCHGFNHDDRDWD